MRSLWVSLLCLAIAALAFAPVWLAHEPPADEELLIISPHWDGIRCEFGRAFTQFYFDKFQKHIRVTWLDIGGTGEIRKHLDERFSQVKPAEGIGADILFGAGPDLLPNLVRDHRLEACALPDELAAQLPASVNGQELRDKGNHWFAACMSAFGFVYNTLVLEQAKLPEPKTWEDLGAPAYRGWISAGDPTLSGSVHAAYEVILQGKGWERGSAVLARMMANARAFNEGGASIPRDVSLGQAAAGPCIDFYAMAPIRRQGATHLRLVVPAETSIATPDCISILRSPPHPAAAREFVLFVLSEAGQRLWYQARGTPGGPREYDLERLPVMPSIYNCGQPTHTVLNPFTRTMAFTYSGKKASDRWGALNDLWRAVYMLPHEELWSARGAVLAAGREADLGAALVRAPLSEDALLAIAAKRLPAEPRNALQQKWLTWAKSWYGAIEKAARENGAAPEFKPISE